MFDIFKKLTVYNTEESTTTTNGTDFKQHNRQVKSFDTIMLNPVTMDRVFILLEGDELNDVPVAAKGHFLYSNISILGENKAFVRLSYLNLTGKKFM